MVAWIGRIAAGIVGVSTARPRWVIAFAALLAAFSTVYAAGHFDIRTDLDALLSDKLAWRAQASLVENEFPSEGEDIVVVIDGATPELASRAASLLTESLNKRGDLFASVQRANGGSFFDRQGLLFLPRAEVASVTSGLIAAQPLLGPLAADPSLRGLMGSVETAVSDATIQPERTAQLDRSLRAITQTIKTAETGKFSPLSWRGILGSGAETPEDRRQFIEIQPKLDYADMMPAAAHTAEIRRAARALSLTDAHGVSVRITGSAPIADDELRTLEETAGPIGLLMFAGMLAILFLAVRSPWVVFSIVVTVIVGAAASSAAGLLVYNRFNLISVAFLPLFVGLGIDFAIQYCVRARAEASSDVDTRAGLIATASAVGGGIVLAVAATASGFFAFLPTDYRGVSELGLIAGVGMVIALALTLTLLPALLAILPRGKAAPEFGFRSLRNADAVIRAGRPTILRGATILAVLALAALPLLRFDFDPMALRSLKTESLALYRDLERNVDTSPNTLNVLAPSLAAARIQARKLESLPQVARAVTIDSFVPDDQPEKLKIIEDARNLLDFTLNPFSVAPAPTDGEIVVALHSGAAALRTQGGAAARDLADAVERLARARPEDRARAQNALLAGLPTALAQTSALLSAEPVDLATLPADIVRDWIAPGGTARVEIYPKAPLRSPAEVAAFVAAARTQAPAVSGDAVTIVESGRTILAAFLRAGALSAIAIVVLLVVAFRSAIWAGLAVVPVLLSGALTFATCALSGLAINLENMIALPLLLGVGVAFNIYFVVARRAGERRLLASSLTRAVLFSALTTGAAFAALAFSAHPGTASMGVLLLIALFWILVTTLLFLPALLSAVVPDTDPA